MSDVFVSYCQKDKVYADFMDLYFKDKDVTIHRDIEILLGLMLLVRG